MRDFLMTDALEVDIGRAVHALAKALDCVGLGELSHGCRVGVISARISECLGWSRARCDTVMLAGLLHDIGISSPSAHARLFSEMECEGLHQHCVLGGRYLQSFAPFAVLATPVYYHHTPWVDLPDTLSDEDKKCANIVFLADRLDVSFALTHARSGSADVQLVPAEILSLLEAYVGRLFAPCIYTAAKLVYEDAQAWTELEEANIDAAVTGLLSQSHHYVPMSLEEVETLCTLLSHIVDAKTPHARNHGIRVADLMQAIAELAGVGEPDLVLYRIVGLLHDIGKLSLPDPAYRSAASLQSTSQFDRTKLLRAIIPDPLMLEWVSRHSRVNIFGSKGRQGYKSNDEYLMQILTAADVFQSLCQKRPGQTRLDMDRVFTIMGGLRDGGEIDSQVYDLLCRHRYEFYTLATLDV